MGTQCTISVDGGSQTTKTVSGPGIVTGVPLVPGGHAKVILLPLPAKRSLLPALVFAETTNVQPSITRGVL
jgi:hypothetical protein